MTACLERLIVDIIDPRETNIGRIAPEFQFNISATNVKYKLIGRKTGWGYGPGGWESALAGVEYGHAYKGIAVVAQDDVVAGKFAVGD